MNHIPSVEELQKEVPLVEITVKGQYIAMIDERRRASRNFKTKVLVPKGFNKSDIKRMTPGVLRDELDDFMSLRTFEAEGKATATQKKMKRADMYSSIELQSFARARAEREKLQRLKDGGRAQMRGGVQDETEYDPNTGLPPIINS